MRYHPIRHVRWCVLTASGVARPVGKLGPVGPGAGQLRKDNAPKGPTPKMPDGKPDFSGVWNPTNFIAMGQPSLTPWADALYKERRANLSKDDPEGHCLPAGVPRISPFPMKMVQTPTLVVMLDEGNVHSYRQFFLDGRGHAKDLDPLWMGDSVAKWDGDTLVVDTIGFNDKTWLNGQGIASQRSTACYRTVPAPGFGTPERRYHSGRSQGVHQAAYVQPHLRAAYGLGDPRVRLQ